MQPTHVPPLSATHLPRGFFGTLRTSNNLLYYAGWICFLGVLISFVLILTSEVQILGVSAWLKPLKFFFSIGLVCWTMAWYMVILQKQRAVRVYSVVVVITLTIELIIISWQSANGRRSHFNVSTPLYAGLFTLMGVAISIFTLWTAYIGILFFKQSHYPENLPFGYIWGIRLGILFFVVFAFEGFVMAIRLAHTVGAPDGQAGLPLFNWSKQYGDLRIAHFFGMHSLQILPLLGYFLARKKEQIILIAGAYFVIITVLYGQAIKGIPLFF